MSMTLNLYSSNDVDQAVDIFTRTLTDILEEMATVKKIQIRTKYAALFSDDAKIKIMARDLAQQTASDSGMNGDWENYKKLRNEVTSQLRVTGSKESLNSVKKLKTWENSGRTFLAE
jgi:hypothetical protein